MSTHSDIKKAAFDHKTCEPDIEKAAFDHKTCEEKKSYSEPICKERKSSEDHDIFEAQQAFDDLHRDLDPPIIATPAASSHLQTSKNYLTARMYIPTHYFLLVILLLIIESAFLFAYTTIGLLKSFPQPAPLSQETRHCSTPCMFVGPDFRPAMQPFVINVAPNIAVGAPLPDVAVPAISQVPSQLAEMPGVFTSLASSSSATLTGPSISSSATAIDAPKAILSGLIPELVSSLMARESLTTTTTQPSASRSASATDEPKATLSNLINELVSSLMARESSTTTTTQPSTSRSAVTQLVLTTTTLPPSSTTSPSVVTLTTVVASSSSPEPSAS